MKTAKKNVRWTRTETRYYKTINVNGELQFQIQEYTTAKVTPMHKRIRDFYPAETRIGEVVQLLGCMDMFVIDKTIASDDWGWAHKQASIQYRVKRELAVAASRLARATTKGA